MVHKIFHSECPSWKKVSRKILQPYTMTNFYNYLNTPYSLSLNTNFASKLQTIDITECQQTNKIYSSNIRKFPKYSTWFAIKALRPVCLHVCMLFKLVCFVPEKRKINDGIFYNDRLLKYRYESYKVHSPAWPPRRTCAFQCSFEYIFLMSGLIFLLIFSICWEKKPKCWINKIEQIIWWSLVIESCGIYVRNSKSLH